MRTRLWIGAAVAVAAVMPPEAVRSVVATAAAALLEATPFVLGSMVLERLFRSRAGIVAFLGCGCGHGPSARSLPAAVALALSFGPMIAASRVAAATLLATVIHARHDGRSHERHDASLPHRLGTLLPAAVAAGFAAQSNALLDVRHATPALQFAAGAALAFAASPCALGAVAIANSLHVGAPFAAFGFLCTAGIADLRAFSLAPRRHGDSHDAVAYAALAVALAVVAWQRGASLVHPAFAPVLGCCALACGALAIAHRAARAGRERTVPALIVAAAFASAPPPEYRATETSLAGVFAGERVAFTGRLTSDGSSSALVRYAITCCRADAAPLVLRLTTAPPFRNGTWLHASGAIDVRDGMARLVPSALSAIAPPSDPFVYR